MNLRVLVAVGVIVIAGLGIFAWQRTTQKADQGAMQQQQQQQEMPSGDMAVMPPTGAPGVDWTTPARWATEPASGVRLATYEIPGKSGGDGAQCAVYFFGQGQGGGVDANVQRWIGEFENPSPADQSTLDVNGMKVHRVSVSGTYFAHAMGGGDGTGEMKDAMLLGAIVEGPNGSLFFKLTGPKSTVVGAEKEFDGMLQSLHAKS